MADQVLMARKAELLICPLLVQEPSKHWSLLVLQRAKAASSSSSTLAEEVEITYGCASCRFAEKVTCCPAKASLHTARKQQELLQLNPSTWPELPDSSSWTVRYWDSLNEPLATSHGLAVGVLNLLAPLGVP